MTRKRFVKLLMAEGYSRNEANTFAAEARNCGMAYRTAYVADSNLRAARIKLKDIDISAMCDAIRNVVDTAWKVASALSKAACAFAKTYQFEMEAKEE